jgi:hypothetical protein
MVDRILATPSSPPSVGQATLTRVNAAFSYRVPMIKLTAADTRKLLQQPETGMGYQIVEATTHDGRTQEGIAVNAELFFYGGESRSILRTASYPNILKLANEDQSAET